MPIQVLMPQLGESVVEGTVTRWLKAIGESVEEYEPLVEINTDKVDTEVPSPAAGKLAEILAPEGTVAKAGMTLAVIASAGEAVASPGEPKSSAPVVSKAPPQADGHAAQSVPVAQTGGPATAITSTAADAARSPAAGARDLGFISPVVAKIAGEYQINLFDVSGTGQGGRITKKDVLAFIERQGSPPAAQETQARPAPIMQPAAAQPPAPIPTSPPADRPQEALTGEGEIQPLTTLRRSIADHMVTSRRTSPHVTTIMEADLSRVVAHRQANKPAFSHDGANLTFTAYFVAASVAALKALPLVNSSWTDAGIRLHRAINIGMATSLGEAGLIVPVIKNADGLSLLGIARAVNDLSERARARQLKPDEVQAGTFTITNHGTSGSLFATPIINQPQCAILGVGMLQKRVVVATDSAGGDSIAIRPMVYLGLTFDHRILDGASADHFLAKVVEVLEGWNG